MRLPDDNKRYQIIQTAADMFSSQAYHKVRLDDVANAAGVGKGTLYVYFHSKEQLYLTVIYEGFELLLGQLKKQLAVDHVCALHRLHTIVDALVNFAFQHPQFFELLKSVGLPKDNDTVNWEAQRNDLFSLIETIIRDGINSGEMHDPNPILTARFIPGLVRSAMLFGPPDLKPDVLKRQICMLLETGVGSPQTETAPV